jgi:hypothetical protein
MENYLLKHRHLEAGPCSLYLYEDEHDARLETHTTKESSSVTYARAQTPADLQRRPSTITPPPRFQRGLS